MQVIRPVDEADVNGLIEGRTYTDALILGPSILAPLDGVEMVNNVFDAPSLEAMLIEVDDDRIVLGVVGLRSVIFRHCRFQNIGFIGTKNTLAMFRNAAKTDFKQGDPVPANLMRDEPEIESQAGG